jgi:hypothetical protein
MAVCPLWNTFGFAFAHASLIEIGPLEEAAGAVSGQLFMGFQWCFLAREKAGSILSRETNHRKFRVRADGDCCEQVMDTQRREFFDERTHL